MLKVEEIKEIRKAKNHSSGYEIVWNENKYIWLKKRRTIIGLLLLIKYETCSEEDLAGANERLQSIKKILGLKAEVAEIKDRYGDANKPFSELWTEEGFTCVHAEGLKGNRKYVLYKKDHDLLLLNTNKGDRVQIPNNIKKEILKKQNNKCNICGAILKTKKEISNHTFEKDRVILEFDHRIPVDRGGKTTSNNIQALCHYCNKCKRQMCFICKKECNTSCALVTPEKAKVVLATNENIIDRINKKH